MKKQKQMLPADNGITVSSRLCTNEKVSMPVLNDILLILLSMLTAISAVMTFVTILNLSIQPEIIIPAIIGFCLFFGVLFKVIKRYRFLVFFGTIIAAGSVFIALIDDCIKGGVILYDQAMQTISEHMKWDAVVHTYQWQDSFLNLTNLTLLLLSFLLCSLVSYFTVIKPSFIATLLLTFPFFEIGAAFGAVPNRLYFGMMLASWTASLTVSRVTNSKIKLKKANGKAKKSPVSGARGKFATSAVSIAAITLCIFLGSSSILNAIGVSRGENMDEIRRDAKSVASSVLDYITGDDNDGSLKEGKLLEVDDRRIKDRHYITMKIFLNDMPPFVKLKGYTASVYKDNAWGQLDNYDEYTGLFEEFSKAGYNVGSLKGSILASHPNCFSEFNFATINLSNFRRKKDYVYEAYYGSFSDECFSNNDTSISYKDGNDSYVYMAVLPSSEDVARLKSAPLYIDNKFKSLWSRYGDMVEKEYTSSAATEKVKEFAASFNETNKYKLVDKIRQYFKAEFEHNYIVNKSPADKDFVEHFLFETKRGYNTHFATAAAVLLQSQNIPARYVEGYFIPQKALLESETDKLGATLVDVTDVYAHAWIEIYDREYGWLPVEVTPGYWDGSLYEEMTRYDVKDETVKPNDNSQNAGVEEPEPEEEPETAPEEEKLEGEKEVGVVAVAPLWIWLLIRIIGVLILLIIAFIAYHYIRMGIRRKMLYSKNIQTSIKAGYKYFLSLASYEGVECNNVYSFMDFAKECCEKSPIIKQEEINRFIYIYLKNTYSKEKATLEEAHKNANFVCWYSQCIYNNLSIFKKFVFKFLKNL